MIIYVIVIHFGKNPSIGGKPLRDSKIIDMKIDDVIIFDFDL